MNITQEFVVSQPVGVVWDFFKDVPKVAQCLPGAEYLGAKEGNKHAGKVSAKIGPFQASFEVKPMSPTTRRRRLSTSKEKASIARAQAAARW